MAEPPLLLGAVNDTVTDDVLIIVAVPIVGAQGTVIISTPLLAVLTVLGPN
jgi:hypothetical protein